MVCLWLQYMGGKYWQRWHVSHYIVLWMDQDYAIISRDIQVWWLTLQGVNAKLGCGHGWRGVYRGVWLQLLLLEWWWSGSVIYRFSSQQCRDWSLSWVEGKFQCIKYIISVVDHMLKYYRIWNLPLVCVISSRGGRKPQNHFSHP